MVDEDGHIMPQDVWKKTGGKKERSLADGRPWLFFPDRGELQSRGIRWFGMLKGLHSGRKIDGFHAKQSFHRRELSFWRYEDK